MLKHLNVWFKFFFKFMKWGDQVLEYSVIAVMRWMKFVVSVSEILEVME